MIHSSCSNKSIFSILLSLGFVFLIVVMIHSSCSSKSIFSILLSLCFVFCCFLPLLIFKCRLAQILRSNILLHILRSLLIIMQFEGALSAPCSRWSVRLFGHLWLTGLCASDPGFRYVKRSISARTGCLPITLPQLLSCREILLVQERARVVPHLVPIALPQSGSTSCGQHSLAIWTPSNIGRVWGVKL